MYCLKQVETTYEALAPSIILSQCFGLMPVTGVTRKDLKFKWKSLRFIYSSMYLILMFINMLFYIIMVITDGITFGSIGYSTFYLIFAVTLLFFLCAFITGCLFIKLAFNWPQIMSTWTDVDHSMKPFYSFPRGLHYKIRIITVIVIGASAVEHSFFLKFKITSYQKNTTDVVDINYFLENNFEHVFQRIPYNIFLGILLEIINFCCTFSWNYMDLFLMLICIAISSRFLQVKKRMQKAANEKIEDLEYWTEIRNDYNKLNLLTRKLNEELSDIILLSYANNLFVILVQLLHTLDPNEAASLLDRFYFVYSFSFLIIRTVAVCLYSAQIHEESSESADILNQLPAEIYNEEIDRLLMQIKMDPSCFTGKGFFKVRKSLVLSIAGAIVTYELIFIQFHIR